MSVNVDTVAQLIAEKHFTSVTVFFDTPLDEATPERPWCVKFVVLTPFKDAALRAAKMFIAQRWPTATPKRFTPHGKTESREDICLYSRNYVREAKAILRMRPDLIVAVHDDTVTEEVSG